MTLKCKSCKLPTIFLKHGNLCMRKPVVFEDIATFFSTQYGSHVLERKKVEGDTWLLMLEATLHT